MNDSLPAKEFIAICAVREKAQPYLALMEDEAETSKEASPSCGACERRCLLALFG
jgi:hypothetical protein